MHGARVVTVTTPGEHAGEEADAAVTAVPGAALAVQTADCAPIVLLSDTVVGVAHAGWRGLAAGVVEAAVAEMRRLGADDIRAIAGPLIGAECYEFGAGDLDQVAAALGDDVRAVTPAGAPALDLAAGVRLALARAGVEPVWFEGDCTACGSLGGARPYSHRARRERERHAAVVWLE